MEPSIQVTAGGNSTCPEDYKSTQLGSENQPVEEAYAVGAEISERSFDKGVPKHGMTTLKLGMTQLVLAMIKEAMGRE